MSWCDKLASTPLVGFALDWHFASADAILDALSPVLDPLGQGIKQKFTMEKHGSFDVAFVTDDGFQYGVMPRQVSVGFQHKLRAKPTSGGPPVMEMLSNPLPYTKLLSQVSDKAVEAAALLPGVRTRKLSRVGIVSTTRVVLDDVPPGIARFIEYFKRPWKGATDYFHIQITTELQKTHEWTDRCIHTLAKPEEADDDLVRVQLDFQRTLTQGRAITKESLREMLAPAVKASTSYFEDLAEGGRFDEEFIRETTRA